MYVGMYVCTYISSIMHAAHSLVEVRMGDVWPLKRRSRTSDDRTGYNTCSVQSNTINLSKDSPCTFRSSANLAASTCQELVPLPALCSADIPLKNPDRGMRRSDRHRLAQQLAPASHEDGNSRQPSIPAPGTGPGQLTATPYT